MVKLIIEVLIIVLVYQLIKGLFSSRTESKAGGQTRNPGGGSNELVEDPQCGVYVPRGDALQGPGGRFFCSRECLEAFERKGG